MRREEFITNLSKKLEMTKKDSRIVMEVFEEALRECILSGEKIKIDGFGTFAVIEVPERNGVDPNTFEQMIIPKHNRVRFRVADSLREEIK